MLTLLLASSLAGLYIYNYLDSYSPPVRDFISPLVTLTMALGLMFEESLSLIEYLAILILIVDSVADFFMDKSNLGLPILLFSLGHVVKQISFITAYYPRGSLIILFISILLLIILIKFLCENYTATLPILLYSLIVGLTYLNLCISEGLISPGFTLFVISDLIIGIEFIFGEIPTRKVRVILVPVLFWIAEAMISHELLL